MLQVLYLARFVWWKSITFNGVIISEFRDDIWNSLIQGNVTVWLIISNHYQWKCTSSYHMYTRVFCKYMHNKLGTVTVLIKWSSYSLCQFLWICWLYPCINVTELYMHTLLVWGKSWYIILITNWSYGQCFTLQTDIT